MQVRCPRGGPELFWIEAFHPGLREPQAPTSASRGLPAGRPKLDWNSVS